MRCWLVVLAACGGPVAPGVTGFALDVALLRSADVGGFHVQVDAVTCGDGTLSESPRVAVTLGLDEGTFLLALQPGCYDVVAHPLTADGRPSPTCGPARALEPARVVPGQTTELHLWAQCHGAPTHPTSEVLANNEPPHILAVSPPPGDVVAPCTASLVCVDVVDPDENDLEATFTHVAVEGPAGARQIQHTDVVGFDHAELVDYDLVPVWRFCSTFAPAESGLHEWRVAAFDLIDGGGGRMDDALRGAPRHLTDGTVIDRSLDERTLWARVTCSP